jgi:hypothetical protein
VRADQGEGIISLIVTKSGQKEIDFLKILQASPRSNGRVFDEFDAIISPHQRRFLPERRHGSWVLRARRVGVGGFVMAMDRVALVACCWFVLWTGLGVVFGKLVGTPGTGTLLGFFFALFSTFAWPWIMPAAINTWMNHDWRDEWRASRRTRS